MKVIFHRTEDHCNPILDESSDIETMEFRECQVDNVEMVTEKDETTVTIYTDDHWYIVLSMSDYLKISDPRLEERKIIQM
jgi:hypothetical protein